MQKDFCPTEISPMLCEAGAPSVWGQVTLFIFKNYVLLIHIFESYVLVLTLFLCGKYIIQTFACYMQLF